ncbi:hypothetical protein BH11MYX2_BH11MYX2_00610 [soil metagenome]
MRQRRTPTVERGACRTVSTAPISRSAVSVGDSKMNMKENSDADESDTALARCVFRCESHPSSDETAIDHADFCDRLIAPVAESLRGVRCAGDAQRAVHHVELDGAPSSTGAAFARYPICSRRASLAARAVSAETRHHQRAQSSELSPFGCRARSQTGLRPRAGTSRRAHVRRHVGEGALSCASARAASSATQCTGVSAETSPPDSATCFRYRSAPIRAEITAL